ncbi:hypothetical protein HOP50_05g37880 [Chloropicon primus]|uniref:Methylenetetrahydrofolate reductase (NAD(P)H) n=1 Tax=Chloropicon primus TaxID=1764295 RepID=A0A5B8MLG1_9CHLO|nr:hypothetical protein A3770_05p37770 [Chloropicon primus]UPR00473.1 hypothetical protein HOP50_05g37880 [Chloropicon primus]|eukprot:QDZ21259.1 hypothetical protein A3770_05p37770 [Chloropicon primus]
MQAGRWMFTVEKASGAARSLESQLVSRKDGRFAAVVQPDLPVSNTWAGLLQRSLGRTGTWKEASGSGWDGGAEEDMAGVDVVQTVGVNLRTRRELRSYLRAKVEECRDKYSRRGSPRMRALLCVSGGHPARRVPFLGGRSGLLADSTDLLEEASRSMEDLGGLALGAPPPSSVANQPFELWCVENPMLPLDSRRLGLKLESGATKVITQPPLIRGKFQKWFEECDRDLRGSMVGDRADPFVVGIPCITSAKSLSFWFKICGVRPTEGEVALMKEFQERQDSLPPEAFDEFCLQHTRGLVELCKGLPNIGGLHFMPVTSKGYKQLLSLDLGEASQQ